MPPSPNHKLVKLEIKKPIWDRFFSVSPLVLIGTKEPDGGFDLAPKHMAFQLGWDNFFGFVCTPRHRTYHNALREKAFTVSYPKPTQVMLACLAAAPRCSDDETKPLLSALPLLPASRIEGVFLKDSFLFLECELERVVDGFGDNSLIAGRVVAAQAEARVLRGKDRDDSDIVHDSPLLAYLNPGRFARVKKTYSFPFPAGFTK